MRSIVILNLIFLMHPITCHTIQYYCQHALTTCKGICIKAAHVFSQICHSVFITQREEVNSHFNL